MRTYITFTCLFFLILTCHGDSILNHINIEKGISYLSDINENCVETCIYFVLANNPKYKTYTYDNIKSIFTAKYGKRPYSMFQIKAFLENLGISVVAKRLENKEDIFKFSAKCMIIYFPPIGNSSIGHFSFMFSHVNNGFYLADPALNPNSIIKFDIDTIFFKRWSGIVLIIGDNDAV